jgi:hypothetical protein
MDLPEGILRLLGLIANWLAGAPTGSRSLADFTAGEVWAAGARRFPDAVHSLADGLADLQVKATAGNRMNRRLRIIDSR